LQIIFHKRATKYMSRLRKMTCKNKGSYESSPPCTLTSSTHFSLAWKGGGGLVFLSLNHNGERLKEQNKKKYPSKGCTSTTPGGLWYFDPWYFDLCMCSVFLFLNSLFLKFVFSASSWTTQRICCWRIDRLCSWARSHARVCGYACVCKYIHSSK